MKLSCFTDEVSQDFEHALGVMAEYGVEGAELRGIWDKNISELPMEDAERAKRMLDAKGIACSCIGSPILKCPVYRAAGDEENTIREDQMKRLDRCVRMADLFGTDIIRVFSFHKTGDITREIEEAIVEALAEMAGIAGRSGKVLALENEPSCFVATGAECARILGLVNLPNVQAAWDVGNGYCAGEPKPYPDVYEWLRGRIAHLHIKDAIRLAEGRMRLTVIGEGDIDYRGLFGALMADGFAGYASLETHYTPLGGTREDGTRLFLRGLKHLLEEARAVS